MDRLERAYPRIECQTRQGRKLVARKESWRQEGGQGKRHPKNPIPFSPLSAAIALWGLVEKSAVGGLLTAGVNGWAKEEELART
jgi:hypothetical protein